MHSCPLCLTAFRQTASQNMFLNIFLVHLSKCLGRPALKLVGFRCFQGPLVGQSGLNHIAGAITVGVGGPSGYGLFGLVVTLQ
jgi:hypothetical protein